MSYNRQAFFTVLACISIFNTYTLCAGDMRVPQNNHAIKAQSRANWMAHFVRKSPKDIENFLHAGLYIHRLDDQKNTFLHQLARDSNHARYYCCMDDLRRKAELFIQAGIDLTAKNKFGDTALDIAKERVKTYKLNYTQPSAELVRILQAQENRKIR